MIALVLTLPLEAQILNANAAIDGMI